MNDHVEISHLIKFNNFRVNRDQVIDLETWFKIHKKMSLMLRKRPPKPYKLSKCYYDKKNSLPFFLQILKACLFHISLAKS